ncbi:DUF2059 domain-containing protein [Leisingera aquaemixtae]|uniref:DUF2059 domain-containing protein n=1 Tax=Leisingera aquaemixtae TaxID=1396826 RepID=A0A0P1HRG5_9RHOB|nr:DUF2059 domain-containing protein [Leisingera aquaemixtae]UWQ26476.1 DUF2059 domain-containing protein [Leisingera aquaemixtae]UWQ38994.1 DUF2059 domain-containing protein [Leisingera aquaemixtae]UWQ43103.1 DUF2059 domain-containing protein [Leisingera aquaemixtae]UWQ47437.1 DUF2059 domain-containing protein [Leisingera aquaemixtae]CUI00893.1 hypothetical protein PHA8399_03032 [Leisingera aquaemixtae]
MQMIAPTPAVLVRVLAVLCFAIAAVPLAARAADRERVEAFLEVTGFDVALDSIALSASSAPEMLGFDTGAFGSQWTDLSQDVFDTREMRGLAVEILENTLDDEALDHASAFYASDLGKRLVRAENASHLIEDDEVKQLAGNRIISGLVKEGSERVAMYQRMGSAIDAAGTGVRALQQIQFRFLMAAAAAGVIELELDAEGLRALMKEQEGDLRLSLQASSLAASAYTYQEFTDAEVQAYVEALEEAPMQRVYELLNAVQYEITANRFEELAHRMAELTPGQDI